MKRDLLIIDLPRKKLVISSDSCASIGNRPRDIIKVDPYIVGRFSARVVLFEVMCVGAKPIAIVNNVSIDTSSAKRLIEGIKDEAEVEVFGSTEDNFPTDFTFLSIFCLGLADDLRIGKSRKGDLVIAVGYPCVGEEVIKNEHNIPDKNTVRYLLNADIHDIIPTGSKGVLHEIRVLEAETNLKFKMYNENFPYEKSCGPSTVIVFTVEEDKLQNIKINKPLTILGRME